MATELSAAVAAASTLQRDLEREVYYGFNLGVELTRLALDMPEDFAALQRIVTIVRERRLASDDPAADDAPFCASCDHVGERSDHDPSLPGLHGEAARAYRKAL